jgi:hypothetical protein
VRLFFRDPFSDVEFSDALYNNEDFIRSITNALGEDGILVTQVGQNAEMKWPGVQYSNKIAEYLFIEQLKQEGFVAIEEYSEAHGGFMEVWKFIIAFREIESFARWHHNHAMIDLELYDRAMDTIDGVESPFRYFDSATMMTYQYPSRVNAEVFCRSTPVPPLCDKGHGLDPTRSNAHISTLEVRQSAIPSAGRGVYAKEDIPKGSYVAADSGCKSVLVMPSTTDLIHQFSTAGIVDHRWRMFHPYLHGYGFQSDFYGEASFSVDASILMFMNHGCDGSFNVHLESLPFNFTEMTVDPKKMPEELRDFDFESQVYNPFARRNHLLYQHTGDITRRDIKAGEELLDSYLNYHTEDVWERAILDLRAQCSEQGRGIITAYGESTE